MSSFMRQYRFIVAICLVGFILRLGLFLVFLHQGGEENLLVVDAGQYFQIAKNLLAGNGFSMSYAPPYLIDGVRTPLYPLWLAFFYGLTHHIWPAVLVQIILNSLLPFFVYSIGKRFIKDKRVLFLALTLTALEPNLVYYTSVVGTEGLFIPLFTINLWFLMRCLDGGRTLRNALYAGAFLSLATLTRPISQFFFIIGGLFLFFVTRYLHQNWRRAIMISLAYVVIFLLVISPWVLRNWIEFKSVSLSSFTWLNFYSRTASSVVALRDHKTYGEAYQELYDDLLRAGIIKNTYDEKELIKLNSFSVQPELRRRAIDIIKSDPSAVPKIYAVTFFNVLTQDNTYLVLHQLGILPGVSGSVSPSLLLFQRGIKPALATVITLARNPVYVVLYSGRAIWFLITLLALLGIAASLRNADWRVRSVATLLAVTLLYFFILALPATASVDARLRVPTEAFEMIFISLGFFTSARYLKKGIMYEPEHF
ncbi:MAG: glycosyltransferase family 39 protein [Candidatus Sungbacteria bacterium]|uniref:Glycosyltransferase family 39 protein n=1 Tax=Candidatus Sungiibacteriota bacterium TaxID=2750080 RepID=A0A9D6LP66_9BACT|nr:glycosyltransferase family 39 protein [Candidatus Sungbacteria bacterium]